jgi:hypothetical protein
LDRPHKKIWIGYIASTLVDIRYLPSRGSANDRNRSHCKTHHDRLEHEHVRQRHSLEAFRAGGIDPEGGVAGRGGVNLKTCPTVARARFRVEADVVDVCPPRPARIKDYNERSRRAGHRRDAQRTRMGESLHRWAVSTLIPPTRNSDQRLAFIRGPRSIMIDSHSSRAPAREIDR